MYAPPCSWRTGMNSIDESASDSFRSSVSSPGIPKTCLTPSASRHSTNTSDALRSAIKNSYLTATLRSQPGIGHLMRVAATLLAIAVTFAATASARAASTFFIRGGGDGSLGRGDQSGRQVGRFAAPLKVTGPGPLTVAGLGRYRGALQFRPAGPGAVQTVDAVGLDDYVRGVISAEMPAEWSPDALKVQAVAARTYALTSNVGGKAFDLYPGTRSQMYRGLAAETRSTNAAVAAARGQIVTSHGLPAITYFFNSSGGYTESIENVWRGGKPEPWLRGVPHPHHHAGGDPYHRRGH